MTFDWKSYLELSSDLEKQATNSDDNREAKLRSSVSRAYYSAFHEARKLLCREIANFESNDYYRNHQAIIYQYESANEKTRKALGADD